MSGIKRNTDFEVMLTPSFYIGIVGEIVCYHHH
jgi:hypothetical protein